VPSLLNPVETAEAMVGRLRREAERNALRARNGITAAVHRVQPDQPQLHPGPAPRQQLRRAPPRTPGFDVFLLDWGVADAVEAQNTLEDYVDDYIPEAIEATMAESGAEELNLIGYCFGGVLDVDERSSTRTGNVPPSASCGSRSGC
jgi:hypothetical protein